MKEHMLKDKQSNSSYFINLSFFKKSDKKNFYSKVKEPSQQSEEIKTLEKEQIKHVLYLELIKEVDDSIKYSEPEKLSKFLQIGYKLNYEQCFYLVNQRKEDLSYSPIILENIIETFQKNSINKIINQIHICINLINSLINSHDKGIKLNFALGDLTNQFDTIFKYIKHADYLDNLEIRDEVILEFLKNSKIIKKELKSIISCNKEQCLSHLCKIINHIEVDKKDAIDAAFNAKLDKYSHIYKNFNHIKDEVTQSIINDIKNFSENDLPKNCLEIVKNIEIMHKEITLQTISIEQQSQIDILYKKRFPQIIKEYVTISPLYREKLTQHNESPDSLLLDSLIKLKEKIEIIFTDIQDKKVNKMRVTNTYLKSF